MKLESLEKDIKTYKELSQKIEELEQQKKILGATIMNQMQSSSVQTPEYVVRKIKRLVINVPLAEAQALQATKMEESVDKQKIKQLLQQGKAVTGVSEIEYLQVSLRSSVYTPSS